MSMPQYVWSSDDYEHDLCRLDQIGTPRPTPPKLPAVDPQAEALALQAADLPLTPKQLRKEVLEAYKQLGGVKYLMRSPLLLEKLLVKIVAEDVKPTPQQNVTVNLPWIQPGRLSYRDNLVDLTPALEANKQLEAKLKE